MNYNNKSEITADGFEIKIYKIPISLLNISINILWNINGSIPQAQLTNDCYLWRQTSNNGDTIFWITATIFSPVRLWSLLSSVHEFLGVVVFVYVVLTVHEFLGVVVFVYVVLTVHEFLVVVVFVYVVLTVHEFLVIVVFVYVVLKVHEFLLVVVFVYVVLAVHEFLVVVVFVYVVLTWVLNYRSLS